jgi:hypothetical protein
MCAAFLAAVLLAGMATGGAPQVQPGAVKLANGNGISGTPGEGLRTWSFSAVKLPNGSVQGHGVLHDQTLDAFARFDITSYTVVDDILLLAGPITAIDDNAPPNFFVGATFFFAVRDGGNGQAIDEISLANAAPIPGLTMDEILALLCAMNPACDPEAPPVLPPNILLPLTAGNIKVFYENL